MRLSDGPQDNQMISHLFFRLLPVQVAIVAMGSINSIVDGIVAARFIDASTVGVVGLYFTMVRILEAAGSVLLGGTAVLSGRYLGSGRLDRTRGICSLGLAAAFLIGALLTLLSAAAPRTIASLLGADEKLLAPLSTYILGYAVGILPQLLAQQLAACLQLERRDRLGQAGILTMIAVNVLLDGLLVAVLKMGVWGLALATSFANWAYFLVLASYYIGGKAQLKPELKLIAWRELPAVLKIGLPNALLVACLAARSLVINRLLLSCSGEDGLSALSAFNMVSGLILALALGAGAVVRILASVFVGEGNREGLLSLIRLVLTRVMAMILGVTAAVILLAPLLAAVFFPDRGSEVYRLTKQLFVIYGCGIPLTLLLIMYANHCQAMGYRLFVNVTSLMDGFFSVVIPAVLLAPLFGALGVWLAFLLGLVITAAVSVAYAVFRCGRWPRSLDEWLMLPSDFGTDERLVLNIRDIGEVTRTAEEVQAFCEARGFSHRTAAFAGLCLEELAGNVVLHGFLKDRKKHYLELRVVIREEELILRIKDDCIPFNPEEYVNMTSPRDSLKGVGIRLVYSIADLVEYQNLLGLNVLTVHLRNEALARPAAPSG